MAIRDHLRWLALGLACALAQAAERPVDYNRDIRQILSENCFSCHGQDAARRKAKLRLDEADEARRDHGGHAAIVPGQPKASELVARITTSDPDDQMPPPDSNRHLAPAQIAMLTRWIAEGAVYQPHWSFQPPHRPPPPSVRDPSWPHGPIDAFIAARLDAEGLSPSPPAPSAAWLRRASLDLTGLPPTPAEIDAFAADIVARGEQAWGAAADRLLGSPRFGERMAQDWLDVSRYADTHGFNNDSARSMWRWRDWVISAFNANMPYDRFITEQLAGDLLPHPTLESRIATGFGRNHVINSEGGIISEEYRVEYVADRVRTLGMAWLGLTMECSRCHDHKFDPITQRDYYRMFAFFNNIDETGEAGRVANASPIMPAPTPDQQERLALLDATIVGDGTAIDRALAQAQPPTWSHLGDYAREAEPAERPVLELELQGCAGGLTNGCDSAAATPAVQDGVAGGEADEVLGTILPALDSGVVVGNGLVDLGKPWTFAAWVRWQGEEGPLASSMNYRVSPASGSYGNGNDVRITAQGCIEVRRAETWPHYSIQAVSREGLERAVWQHVVVSWGGGTKAKGLRVYIDGGERSLAIMHDDLNGSPAGTPRLGADLQAGSRRFSGQIAGVRFYASALPQAEVAAWSEGMLARHLARGRDRDVPSRTAWACALVSRHRNPPFAALWRDREAARSERFALERDLPQTMVMEEMAHPRQAHILRRGQYDGAGEDVEPGVPSALAGAWPAGAPRNRLGLAEWLTAADQPLTARVVVNRFWQQFFGTGLVKSVEDFGHQGEYPSHPELLDWLACEFVGSGWNVKALLRQLVLSATYRQDSAISQEVRERDLENRLLARGPRLRLSAEMIRDQALAVSGLLRERIGGASVFPYQPADLYKGIVVDAPYPGTSWTNSTGDDLYRRSLYSFWKRTVPYPVLSVLDAPDREVCSARRSRTNTPLQALTLMNETGFVEAARALAVRMLREGGTTDGERLGFGFRLATGRLPQQREAAILAKLLEQMRASYRADPDAAHQLLGVGASAVDAVASEPELAAHAALAGMILNLDETITKN